MGADDGAEAGRDCEDNGGVSCMYVCEKENSRICCILKRVFRWTETVDTQGLVGN